MVVDASARTRTLRPRMVTATAWGVGAYRIVRKMRAIFKGQILRNEEGDNTKQLVFGQLSTGYFHCHYFQN